MKQTLDTERDLILEKTTDIKPELIWRAWTQPELLMKWFCPLPWKTVDCRIDLQPGGEFMTVMQGPDGTSIPPNSGCYLEVVPNKKLVFTSALLPGYRPAPPADLHFTAMILLEPVGEGTKYTAIAKHADQKSKQSHEAMGFVQGWGMAFHQLVQLMR